MNRKEKVSEEYDQKRKSVRNMNREEKFSEEYEQKRESQ